MNSLRQIRPSTIRLAHPQYVNLVRLLHDSGFGAPPQKGNREHDAMHTSSGNMAATDVREDFLFSIRLPEIVKDCPSALNFLGETFQARGSREIAGADLRVQLDVLASPLLVERVFEGKEVGRFQSSVSFMLVPNPDPKVMLARAAKLEAAVRLMGKQSNGGKFLLDVARDAGELLHFVDGINIGLTTDVSNGNMFYSSFESAIGSLSAQMRTFADQKIKEVLTFMRRIPEVVVVMNFIADKEPEAPQGEPAAARLKAS